VGYQTYCAGLIAREDKKSSDEKQAKIDPIAKLCTSLLHNFMTLSLRCSHKDNRAIFVNVRDERRTLTMA
jgi:hypothetical protein